jgi:hypothetical protein
VGLVRNPPDRTHHDGRAVTYEIAEHVLKHAMGKLERVYNRHGYRQEKAQALQ